MTDIAAAVRWEHARLGMPAGSMLVGSPPAENAPAGTGAERLPPPCKASDDDG